MEIPTEAVTGTLAPLTSDSGTVKYPKHPRISTSAASPGGLHPPVGYTVVREVKQQCQWIYRYTAGKLQRRQSELGDTEITVTASTDDAFGSHSLLLLKESFLFHCL